MDMSQNFFNPDGYAVTATQFVYAGDVYEVGKPFPHHALGVIEHALRGLWMAGLIRFEPVPVQAAEVKVDPNAAAKPRQKPAMRTE